MGPSRRVSWRNEGKVGSFILLANESARLLLGVTTEAQPAVCDLPGDDGRGEKLEKEDRPQQRGAARASPRAVDGDCQVWWC